MRRIGRDNEKKSNRRQTCLGPRLVFFFIFFDILTMVLLNIYYSIDDICDGLGRDNRHLSYLFFCVNAYLFMYRFICGAISECTGQAWWCIILMYLAASCSPSTVILITYGV